MIFDKEDYKAFDPELWNAIDAHFTNAKSNFSLQSSAMLGRVFPLYVK